MYYVKQLDKNHTVMAELFVVCYDSSLGTLRAFCSDKGNIEWQQIVDHRTCAFETEQKAIDFLDTLRINTALRKHYGPDYCEPDSVAFIRDYSSDSPGFMGDVAWVIYGDLHAQDCLIKRDELWIVYTPEFIKQNV